jgi:hypothetical protein
MSKNGSELPPYQIHALNHIRFHYRSFQFWTLENAGKHSICDPETGGVTALTHWEQESIGPSLLARKSPRNILKATLTEEKLII